MGATPTPRVVLVDGVPMSGLLAESAQPRGVVIAIHGGATTGAYFDCPDRPELSLLHLAPRLGFTAIALDRPGFGASALYADAFEDTARRADMTYAAIEKMLADRPRGAGVFLLAHSNGTELALRLAAHAPPTDLLGVEIAGTGLSQQDSARAVLDGASMDNIPSGLRSLLWEPAELYPPGVAGSVRIKAGPISPGYEAAVVEHWVDTFATLAAAVTVPVRYTVAEFERVWRTDESAVNEVAALFSRAPSVQINRQRDAGHNLSLGHTAGEYHRGVMEFAAAAAAHTDSSPSAEEAS